MKQLSTSFLFLPPFPNSRLLSLHLHSLREVDYLLCISSYIYSLNLYIQSLMSTSTYCLCRCRFQENIKRHRSLSTQVCSSSSSVKGKINICICIFFCDWINFAFTVNGSTSFSFDSIYVSFLPWLDRGTFYHRRFFLIETVLLPLRNRAIITLKTGETFLQQHQP